MASFQNTDDKLKRLETIEKEAAQLRKLIEEEAKVDDKFSRSDNEEYFYVDEGFRTAFGVDKKHHSWADGRYNVGNYFKEKTDANTAAEYLRKWGNFNKAAILHGAMTEKPLDKCVYYVYFSPPGAWDGKGWKHNSTVYTILPNAMYFDAIEKAREFVRYCNKTWPNGI